MPDFEVEMTYTTEQHQAIVKSVTVQNCAKLELAKVMGIQGLLEWAEEDESPIPLEALDYCWSVRANGNVMVYEVLSELDTRWHLTFGIHEVREAPAVSWPAPSRPVSPHPPAVTKAGAPPPRPAFDFKAMLADQLEFLQGRQKELTVSRKELEREWSENASAIADIRNFLMVSAPRRRCRRPKLEVVSE